MAYFDRDDGGVQEEVLREDGAWDEGHAQPIWEVMQTVSDPNAALAKLRADLEEDPEWWIEQQDDDMLGDATDEEKEACYRAYVDGYINATRARLFADRVLPKTELGKMSPQQWLATRQQRAASGAWGDNGEVALEREVFVRDAILEQIRQKLSELAPDDEYRIELAEYENAILSRPGIVRSGQDPAMTFFVGRDGSIPSKVKQDYATVYVLDDDVSGLKARDLFGTTQAVRRAVVNRLELLTGVRWESGVNIGRASSRRSQDTPFFRDLEQPIEKRNPGKSMLASSSWTTAREKLRSAVATKQPTKKNPWPPDHSSVAEVASEERVLGADWYREHGLTMLDLLRDCIEADDPANVSVVDEEGNVVDDGDAVAITKRGTVIVVVWDPILKRAVREEWDLDRVWLNGTDAPNSLETNETRGGPGSRWAAENLTQNSPGPFTDRQELERCIRRGDCAVDVIDDNGFVTDYGQALELRGRHVVVDIAGDVGEILERRRVPITHILVRATPFAQNPEAVMLEDAKAKFEEFHAKKPTKVGEFASSFSIPSTIGELGKAVHVLYRSDKKDPVTKRQAKKPVDYIHEHYAGVKCYAVDDELEQCDVPAFIQNADALVLLGLCLGFRFEDDGGEHDAEGSDPLPELYATPCGKALIVVQSKKEVLAMIWGGGLGVWARGIDG